MITHEEDCSLLQHSSSAVGITFGADFRPAVGEKRAEECLWTGTVMVALPSGAVCSKLLRDPPFG